MLGFKKLPFVGALLFILVTIGVEIVGSCWSVGLSALAIFDLLVLMTVLLIGAPFLITNATTGRIQGFATFGFSMFVLPLAIAVFGVAVTLFFKMLLSFYFVFPYIFNYADFPVSGSAPFLAGAMFCKFAFCICMILAHEKFLANIGLVLIVLTSLLLTMMLSFLHGLPTIIVSLTDDIGAIIIAVVTCVRAVGFILSSLPAVKKAIGI